MGGSGSAAARLLVAISLHSSELELERARLDDLCSAHPTLHLRLNSFDGQSSGAPMQLACPRAELFAIQGMKGLFWKVALGPRGEGSFDFDYVWLLDGDLFYDRSVYTPV